MSYVRQLPENSRDNNSDTVEYRYKYVDVDYYKNIPILLYGQSNIVTPPPPPLPLPQKSISEREVVSTGTNAHSLTGFTCRDTPDPTMCHVGAHLRMNGQSLPFMSGLRSGARVSATVGWADPAASERVAAHNTHNQNPNTHRYYHH